MFKKILLSGAIAIAMASTPLIASAQDAGAGSGAASNSSSGADANSGSSSLSVGGLGQANATGGQGVGLGGSSTSSSTGGTSAANASLNSRQTATLTNGNTNSNSNSSAQGNNQALNTSSTYAPTSNNVTKVPRQAPSMYGASANNTDDCALNDGIQVSFPVGGVGGHHSHVDEKCVHRVEQGQIFAVGREIGSKWGDQGPMIMKQYWCDRLDGFGAAIKELQVNHPEISCDSVSMAPPPPPPPVMAPPASAPMAPIPNPPADEERRGERG